MKSKKEQKSKRNLSIKALRKAKKHLGKQMGFTTKEEFVRGAIRFRLNWLKSGNECLEIPREQYEELNEAVKEMDMPFRTAEQFVNSQMDAVLEKYAEYKKSRR